MKKSPWAKFKTPSTPNSRASPAATRAREAPTTRPFSAATTTVSTGSVLSLQVGGDQLLRAGQVTQLVLARDHPPLHHVQATAHRLQQVEGGVVDQHQLRPQRESSGQRQHLLLATAQGPRQLAPAFGKDRKELEGGRQAGGLF